MHFLFHQSLRRGRRVVQETSTQLRSVRQKLAFSLFLVGSILSLLLLLSPSTALVAGALLVIICGQPLQRDWQEWPTKLLAIAIVALGFGMRLGNLKNAGFTGLPFTLGEIVCALLLGL